MFEYISLIASISVTIGTLLYVKRMGSTSNILNKIDEITDEIMQNTDLQKKLYVVGNILGQGIKGGVGLGGGSGKVKMGDLAMQGISMWLQKTFGLGQQPQQEEQTLIQK